MHRHVPAVVYFGFQPLYSQHHFAFLHLAFVLDRLAVSEGLRSFQSFQRLSESVLRLIAGEVRGRLPHRYPNIPADGALGHFPFRSFLGQRFHPAGYLGYRFPFVLLLPCEAFLYRAHGCGLLSECMECDICGEFRFFASVVLIRARHRYVPSGSDIGFFIPVLYDLAPFLEFYALECEPRRFVRERCFRVVVSSEYLHSVAFYLISHGGRLLVLVPFSCESSFFVDGERSVVRAPSPHPFPASVIVCQFLFHPEYSLGDDCASVSVRAHPLSEPVFHESVLGVECFDCFGGHRSCR